MTKIKWALTLLVLMDLVLIFMHLTGYFILVLKPTGYVIPFAINIIVLSIIYFRNSSKKKLMVYIGLFLCIPIMLIHGFMVWLADYSYIKVDSPHNQQSLVIEYRHFSLGETTYFYHFYKTKFGFIGKFLDEQSFNIIVQGTEHPGFSAEDILGINNPIWITKDIVRFQTWKGIKDIYLNPSHLPVNTEEIEDFIDKAESNIDGETITINGNRLVTRYDELSGQSWIDVTSDNDEGAIPRQQCSRIVRNEERRYYMLEECTHKWEYPLYPIIENK
jgi:RNase P/RNase MRP subunit p29